MTEYFMPISELSKKLDIPAHTLRYWEKEFPTLIQPTTGAGGRGYYRNETVDNITRLKKYLYADGYTIDGVKKLIAQNEFANAAPTSLPAPTIPEPEINGADLDTAIDLLTKAKDILLKG